MNLLLVRDFLNELSNALRSLQGKDSTEPISYYVFYVTAQVARWIDGYICLRETNKTDASRLLIRPSIEAIFRIQAVRAEPEIFIQIAFTEFEE